MSLNVSRMSMDLAIISPHDVLGMSPGSPWTVQDVLGQVQDVLLQVQDVLGQVQDVLGCLQDHLENLQDVIE